MKINSNFFQAPDLVLDEIAKINQSIERHKAKKGEDEAYKQFAQMRNVMVIAYRYMLELKKFHDLANFLQAENEFLKKFFGDLQERLNQYEALEATTLSGDSEEMLERVKLIINKKSKL